MKKLLTTLALAAALAAPAAPASAAESNPGGVKDCPPGYTGYVVWVETKFAGYQELVWFCIPWGP
ncbi:MAG TPA: hypothetical protein VG318_18475 [Actinomycetota bacterium]|nr:hypothetical protein [Actinomycetota bacterium]